MTSASLRILQRTLRLPQLKQGGTLSVTSSELGVGKSSAKIPPIHVRVVPGWRDDAEIQLWQQIFDDGKNNSTAAKVNGGDNVNGDTNPEDTMVGMRVTAQLDGEGATALGKSAGHVAIQLDLKSATDAAAANSNITDKSSTLEDLSGDIALNDMTIPVEIDESEDDDEYHVEEDDEDDDDDEYETFDDEGGIDTITLIANVPEKLNLNCNLQGSGHINIEGKLEGEQGFDLRTADGNITVKKLRGDSINLSASAAASAADDDEEDRFSNGSAGVINTTDSLEAQNINVEAEGRIRAKMVNGTDVNLSIPSDTPHQTKANNYASNALDVDDVGALIDIGSLYTSRSGNGANIEVSCPAGTAGIPRAVRLKSSHGHVTVAASVDDNASDNIDEFDQRVPVVDLGGVNGSCDVLTKNTASKPADALATRVHVDSLTLDSVSFINAKSGDVDLTIDRKVEADLRLLSCPEIAKLDADALLVDDDEGMRKEISRLDVLSSPQNDPTSVVDEAGSSADKIYVQTNAFTPTGTDHLSNGTEYVEGSIHNRSFEPDSRFDVKTKHTSASTTVNRGIGKVNIMGAAAQALAGFSGQKDGVAPEQRPLFAVASSGKIKVETVSWFGAIARRYGMEDHSKHIGRQASREPRLK